MLNKGKTYLRGIALLLIVLGIGTSTVLMPSVNAQSGDTQTIVSPHKTYEFDAPAGWELSSTNPHTLQLSNGTTDIFLQDRYGIYVTSAKPPWDSPTRLLTERISDGQAENETLTEIEIDGSAFARMDFATEQYGPVILLATVFDNGDPMVLGASLVSNETLKQIPVEDIETLYAIAASLRSITDPIPNTLESYEDGWQAVVEELIDKGLVPTSGGQLLFDIPDAYVDGTGLFARMLSDIDASVRNLILGADIDFQVPGDLDRPGSCILEARVDLETDDRGYQSGFVSFYLRSDGKLYIRTREDVGPNISVYVDYSKFTGTQINLVAYLIEDRLTAYVNGQLVGHNILIPDQAGPFMIALDVQGENVQCDMHVWAYELP